MTNRILEKKSLESKKLDSIDTAQLEYTAEKIFTYGTISIAVMAIYAAVVYGGASIIYAGTKKLKE